MVDADVDTLRRIPARPVPVPGGDFSAVRSVRAWVTEGIGSRVASPTAYSAGALPKSGCGSWTMRGTTWAVTGRSRDHRYHGLMPVMFATRTRQNVEWGVRMGIRKLAIKEDKTPLLTLVRAFSSPVLFWRGEWFAWTGTHYEQVAQQGIERQVMAFLEEKSPTAVNGSMIHRFMDLLRIVRHADHPTSPCWLTTGRLLSPTELFAVGNGLLHVAGGPELLPHDPAFFGLSAVSYDYCPFVGCRRWQQFLNDLWGDATAPVQLLQDWFGYCLLPDTSQQKILAINGPPRSGKSTITRVLRALLGSRNVACPPFVR